MVTAVYEIFSGINIGGFYQTTLAIYSDRVFNSSAIDPKLYFSGKKESNL